ASEQEIANECELNVISGTIYYDTNGSGDYSPATDAVVPYYKVFSTHSTGTSTTFSKAYGDYSNYVGTGNINTDVEDLSMFAFTPVNGFNNNFTGYGNVASGDFEAQTTNTVQDVSIDLIATIATRPGFTAGYKLIAINKGSVPVSGTIELPYNSNLFTYQTSVPAASTVSTGMLNWSYNLGPFERLRIDVEFLVAQPPVLIGGETEAWTATINPIPGDANPQDNVFYYNNNIVNSYDPNDKTVFEGAEILPTELDEYLHYRIRFQNTGNASAINVTVKDTLSDNLDWDTFEPIDMSHDVGEIHIENKKFIDFDFPNINLPDSTTNEPLSHGYIYYRIKPKQNLIIGDFIDNTAHIYFDFNEAIITNTATTTIVQTLSNSDQEFLNISLYPNPVADIVQLQTSEKIDFAVIMNLQGQLLIETTDKDINVSNLDTGVYFIRVTSGNKSQVLKFIKK
ncbi:T9SS type A sorting domain-containing protein, partial [Nonlabens ulvanivorans]